MEQVNHWLNEISGLLSQLNGMPGYMLCFIAAIGIGFLLKRFRRFPNEGIPTVVVLCAMFINVMLADPRTPDTTPFRIWMVRNAVVGLIIGVLAWLFHRFVIKTILAALKKRFPTLQTGDTATLTKPNDP